MPPLYNFFVLVHQTAENTIPFFLFVGSFFASFFICLLFSIYGGGFSNIRRKNNLKKKKNRKKKKISSFLSTVMGSFTARLFETSARRNTDSGSDLSITIPHLLLLLLLLLLVAHWYSSRRVAGVARRSEVASGATQPTYD